MTATALRIPAPLREAVDMIGRHIIDSAMWSGDRCTWTVMAPDLDQRPRRVPKATIAGPGLYQGTAGIALFLAELARVTGNAAPARTALAALRYALDKTASSQERRLSFYSGSVGIAWAAARAGLLLNREDLTGAARDLVRGLDGMQAEDRTYDVIGGAAGAIPALLQLSGLLHDDALVVAAIRYGRQLAHAAHLEPIGWSWSGNGGTSVRNLLGYAHGAAGIGHAFTELHYHTGFAVFRYAALQAFEYERQFFDPTTRNWPDHRNPELFEFVYDRRLDELAERLRRGENPVPYRRSLMNAWCHGAPGIGSTRLRAFAVFGDPVFEQEARHAVEATLQSVCSDDSNYSLCHGIAGNCETLLLASDQFHEQRFRVVAEERMATGALRYSTSPGRWPCGTQQNVNDPSLMLGEAGIGYFILRLLDPLTPSILLPVSPRAVRAPETRIGEIAACRARHVGVYLHKTLTAIARLQGKPLDLSQSLSERLPTFQAAFAAVRSAIGNERDVRVRALLEEITQLDEAAYQLAAAISDFSEPFTRNLRREGQDDAPVDRRLTVAPTTRVLHLAHDWFAWLAQTGSAALPIPAEDPTTYVLFRQGNSVATIRSTPLLELVLIHFTIPATAAEALARIEAEYDDDATACRAAVTQAIAQQIDHAYRAGILVEDERQ